MARGIHRQSYLSTSGNVLYLTPVFTYEVSVYSIKKNLTELLYCSNKYSLTPINIISNCTYKKQGKTTIITTIEWTGAPRKYLQEHNYKQVDIEDLKIKPKKRSKK